MFVLLCQIMVYYKTSFQYCLLWLILYKASIRKPNSDCHVYYLLPTRVTTYFSHYAFTSFRQSLFHVIRYAVVWLLWIFVLNLALIFQNEGLNVAGSWLPFVKEYYAEVKIMLCSCCEEKPAAGISKLQGMFQSCEILNVLFSLRNGCIHILVYFNIIKECSVSKK